MCLTFFNFSSDRAKTPTLIIFNRDESLMRESTDVEFWLEDNNILAGRDVLGGTWLGINLSTGNLSFLTNLEDDLYPMKTNILAKSRGKLISNFLSTAFFDHYPSTEDYVDAVIKESSQYNPFNAVFGNIFDNLFYFCDIIAKKKTLLKNNVFNGFSNNYFLKHTWPKVEKGLILLKSAVMTDENIFDCMRNDSIEDDVNPEDERPIFINPYFNQKKFKPVATVSTIILKVFYDRVEVLERKFESNLEKIKDFIFKRNGRKKLKGIFKLLIFLRREKKIETKMRDVRINAPLEPRIKNDETDCELFGWNTYL